jgi:hypothetical protein
VERLPSLVTRAQDLARQALPDLSNSPLAGTRTNEEDS